MSSSSHPTALPDPRVAIRRVINLGRDEKVVRAVYLDVDKLVDCLVDSLLHCLVDNLGHSLIDLADPLQRHLDPHNLLDSLLEPADPQRRLELERRLDVHLDVHLDVPLDVLLESHLAPRLQRRLHRRLDRLVHGRRLDRRLDRCFDTHLDSRLVSRLVSLLDWLLDRLLDQFDRVDRVLRHAVGNAIKKSMVRRVRRNPEIAVKILHELSGNRIVKGVKGDYHFKVIMGNYEYIVYKYAMDILMEGLFNNEDPKVTAYNFQLLNDEVAMINVRLLSNSPDTKNMDAINYRYILDCAEAELAVATRLVRRGASRGDASRAFRYHLRTYQNDKARFKALRRMLQGTNISISDDLLDHMTSSNPNGIMIGIRNNGNRAAHCDSKQEGELQASIERQSDQLPPCMEELRVVGLNYR